MIKVCFTTSNSKWYHDNDFLKHMNKDKNIFLKKYFIPKNGGYVSYGDNNKGRIVDSCTIGKNLIPT